MVARAVVGALAAAAIVCFVGWSAPAYDALLGKGDEWVAKEDSMALDVADEMAKRYVPPGPSPPHLEPAR